ncbi:MAG: hypothetical protein HY674_15875 [Chloroflexi bacterium]|nr:hypothetical protein [Chloroflexota bacterium]
MKPRLPAPLLETLRQSGQPPPWKCKLQLRHGRTVYGVEISSKGEITSVGGRTIYSASDFRFGPASIEHVILS